MLPSFVVSLIYDNSSVYIPFLITMLSSVAAGVFLLKIFQHDFKTLRVKDGFLVVTLCWFFSAAVGAVPFVVTGSIPNPIDAFFESCSGFSTTGASILTDVEVLPKGILFWRSFTHWIGGMGVLVFIMAVLPMSGEHSMHIMRAEVPGPTVGKLVPRARKTASILYLIYVALTAIETVMLMCGGMSFYDALLHAFATAGTGGFSTRAASIGAFHSLYIEMVTATFMLIFAVNFNLYFLLLIGRLRDVVKNEELHWYLGIVGLAVLGIALGIREMYGGMGTALRHAYFNVATIISTTGFGTEDFNLWPEYCKWILVLLMFVGACAGSTGGGLKVSRVAMLFKTARSEIKQMIRPRSVAPVQMDGRRAEAGAVRAVSVFFLLFVFLLLAFTFAVSFDGYDLATNFTATLSCLSNIGPGLSLVGPTGNFSIFSYPSKILLSFAMLLGRLEIYPILVLFSRHTWKN